MTIMKTFVTVISASTGRNDFIIDTVKPVLRDHSGENAKVVSHSR
jgi:hypothetical protein